MNLFTDDPLLTIRLYTASYVLDVAKSSDLRTVAERALLGNLYSPALAELAETTQPIMSDVGPLFERAIRELGEQLPAKEDAAWMLTRHCVQLLVDKRASEEDVLRYLYWKVLDSVRGEFPEGGYVGEALDVHWLVGLFHSYDEPNENYYDPEKRLIESETERRELLDRLVHEEAVAWLERHPA